MNATYSPRVASLRLLFLSFLAGAIGFAQSTPPVPPPASTEMTVELSPFSVVAEKDEGFVASASLAGGRLKTELRDTPIAYSVLTREFLDALNLFDQEEALSWSVGAYQPIADVTNYRYFNNEAGSSIISRGIQTTRPLRNFFQLGVNTDTYSQDRIDFSRGPNALLVGTGGLGGNVITSTKRARTDRTFGSIGVVGGSWSNVRGTIDYNQRLSEDLAVRVNLLAQSADTWRDREFDRRRGIHLATTYRVGQRTVVRAEMEHYRNEVLKGREAMIDRVSGWDGLSVVAAPTATVADADAKGLARNGSSTTPYLLYIPGSDPGTFVNWANTWTTQGGAANANVPVAGVRPLSTANLAINGGRMFGDVYAPGTLYAKTLAGAPSFALPDAGTVIAPTSPGLVYTHDDYAVFLEHQQGKHLFLEIAAHHADTSKLSEYIMARTIMDARIDVNRTLPTGEPNPNFLEPYGDSSNSHQYFENTYTEMRAAAALVFEKTRWGTFRGNIIVGDSRQEAPTYRMADVLNRNPDIRLRSRDDQFTYRFYWNTPASLRVPESVRVVDPVAGTESRYSVGQVVDLNATTNNRQADTEYQYVQGALNAQLFGGRMNLLGGARRDRYVTESWSVNSSAAALFNDYPSNWDGRSLIWRPAAPGDYWTMTYVPKNAAGAPTGPETLALTRPRTNGVPQAQYANDRFRDDYSSPPVEFDISTVSLGGVLHVLRWLSVYSNYSETFNPPTSGLTLTGASVPPGFSEGQDIGLRFSLLGGRVSASVGYYSSSQENNAFDSSGSTRKYANIAAANVVGDLSANGSNRRGLALIPTPTFDFQDREASGYELDVVANLTPNWRLTVNFSDPEVFTTNTRQDEWAFLQQHEATLRQIVLDAGAVIGSNNVASVDTAVPVANRSPDVAAAVTGWNDIQTFKSTNDPTIRTFSNLPEKTANLYTDYRFTRGLLKDLRLGGGVQYLGKRVIGNRGADTIVNPANPAQAIDDPSVDLTSLIYMDAVYTATATVGYRIRLKDGASLDLNLAVRNLLDERDPIFGVGLRPPGGDLSRPDRQATRIAFLNRDPRSFSLSARLSF